MRTLKTLHEEVKPLGFRVSWAKTKVQIFGGLLDDTVASVQVCGEDSEVLEDFTHIRRVAQNSRGCSHEVFW